MTTHERCHHEHEQATRNLERLQGEFADLDRQLAETNDQLAATCSDAAAALVYTGASAAIATGDVRTDLELWALELTARRGVLAEAVRVQERLIDRHFRPAVERASAALVEEGVIND